MPHDKKIVKTVAWLIAFAVVLNAAVHNIATIGDVVRQTIGILSPLLVGLALAFLLNIPMDLFERRVFVPRGKRALKLQASLRRPLSMLLSVLFLLVVVTLISVIVLPQLIDAITQTFAQLPNWVAYLKAELQRFEDDVPEIVTWVEAFNFDWAAMQADIVGFFKQGLSLTLGNVASVASSMFGTVASAAISIVFALSVLASKERLAHQLMRLLRAFIRPARAERIIEICRITNQAFSGFVTGQITESCILGTLCFLGMTLLGFPNALLISTLVGVAAVVPIFGSFVSAGAGALLIAASDGIADGLWFALFFVVLQQLEGNLIYPRVMGKRVGLPVIWVLAAITVGGGLLGVVGMLLSIPIIAVVYALLRETVDKHNAMDKWAKDRPTVIGRDE